MADIKLRDVSVIYKRGTPQQVIALEDVSLAISGNEFIGLIGPTGSGKSTLVQLLNGLLKADRGRVFVDGIDVAAMTGAQLKDLRRKVGLVFQYPESQLFDETVAEDIAFGPKNLGVDKGQIEQRVREAMGNVGLDYSVLKDRSPFSLSGGQMRRAAIAGVLAMRPQILILDEPTAGMDPRGRREILDRIVSFQKELGITVILVSHNMTDVCRLAQKVFILHQGRLVGQGSPREVFSRANEMRGYGLDVPEMTALMSQLQQRGIQVRTDVFTVGEAKRELLRAARGKENA